MIYKALAAVYDNHDGLKCVFINPMTEKDIVKTIPHDRLEIRNIMAWAAGDLIQDAMPKLTVDERELFLNANMMGDN